jgi:hypothetical protein
MRLILASIMIAAGAALAFRVNVQPTLSAFAWTAIELMLAMFASGAISLVGLVATGNRAARGLDVAVSRALEVTAALPIVLACAVVVVTLAWRTAVAVAVVTGTLNGLRCLRLLTLARATAPGRINMARRVASLRHALIASQSELLPQLLGLEAAIEYLGLLEKSDGGGLGKYVAAALLHRNSYEIWLYCLICTGLVLLSRVRTRRAAQATSIAPLGPSTPR